MTLLNNRLLITQLAFCGLCAAIVFAIPSLGGAEAQAQPQPGSEQRQQTSAALSLPQVTVTTVQAASYTRVITAHGTVKATHALTLSSEVGGRVTQLHPDFKQGARLPTGTVLARIDDTQLQQALASAEVSLAQAKLDAEEEKLQSSPNKAQWRQLASTDSNGILSSLRAPQQDVVATQLSLAKAQLQSARYNLAASQFTLPFDATIVTRSVQPGSYVQPGSPIATLYSTAQAEVSVELSAEQWQHLPTQAMPEGGWSVTLNDATSATADTQWHGQVTRLSQHIDPQSRQRLAIVSVDNPLDQAQPLYFGSYVEVHIEGAEQNDLWRIPASALSQQNHVWYVDEENRLAHFTPQLQFRQHGAVYIKARKGMHQANIVLRPLSAYLDGMKVTPVTEEHAHD
ncbi:efflux RND transporter periplasmic adaptor subunit [Pseudoalteromonas sp. DL2-H2.2]|uniref:efflux RND transporter periplasmic adaptor subunit n=1 Tax=Pseudoalteromonas sp. DL2-H2.2 TaxID=2908889 RepID=UPI001F2ACF29|nr:efflux RND transporter periplasmic adaptor subunit [Pseudoalteromonas sp. DL2-H2.2]MCF2911120.1 efflux RND transporter periplasmic adaptor subunit [Pseudoalteromonas sp. DL2-H2.2]